MRKGIYILLGSNMGDREKNLLLAIKKISSLNGKVISMSSVYQSQPWGNTNQPVFLNQVMELESNHSARDLMTLLQKIEKEIGQKATEHWGPREIDIDILFYGNELISEKDLLIPHPEIPNRRFTLVPFCEIAPNFVHPSIKKTCKQLLFECKDMLEVSLYQA